MTNDDDYDHRPVLEAMAKMPEAKRYGKYKRLTEQKGA